MTPGAPVLWTARTAQAATGGEAQGDWAATSLSIDTRTLPEGALFVALADRRDGHDFVAEALARGAAAALVSRRPEGVAAGAPLLIVDDVMDGLRALARAARARTGARVVAVTGSVGKTSVKEMLRCALQPFGLVHAAEKSFNNHWGVPLTLAGCPQEADFAVIEIGMNHPGEIAPLAAIAAPDVSLITTIAAAHLEAFSGPGGGGMEGIAREKAVIFGGLRAGGTAIWPAGLPTSAILEAAAAGAAHRLSFGSDGAEARLLPSALDAPGSGAAAEVCGERVALSLAQPGRHIAMNALATLTATRALGLDLRRAAAGLAGWAPPPGRGTHERLGLPGGGTATLIDDAYNANPTSLAAALEGLAGSEAARRVAILGDMLELGPQAAALHAELAEHPAMARIDVVHCVGPLMRGLWEALPTARRGEWQEGAVAMAGRAACLVAPGDAVLVKSSLGTGLSRVVDALRETGHGGAPAASGT